MIFRLCSHVSIIFFVLFAVNLKVASAGVGVLEIAIDIRNHKFEPDLIYVPAGQKLRVAIHNHDSTIEEFDSVDLKREKIITGNSQAWIILAPLKVGEYKFMGEFHEETAQGKFVVLDESEYQDMVENARNKENLKRTEEGPGEKTEKTERTDQSASTRLDQNTAAGQAAN